MNVLYDYQTLMMQKFGGISRYYYELAKGMSAKPDVNVDVVSVFNKNYYFKDYFDKKKPESLPSFLAKGNNVINRAYVLMQNRKKYDIIHPSYYHPYILNKFKGKLVTTVHDMIYELFPDVMPGAKKLIKEKKAHIFCADQIVCVSEYTKNDLLKIYPTVPESKIKVIKQGNVLELKDGDNLGKISKLDGVDKYILFTGNREYYKNFRTFVRGVSGLLKRDDCLTLVCGGGGAFSEEEKEFLSDSGVADKCIQINYTDSESVSLYHNAECFVFPSLYEGFGLPILEAWGCKCPLALSNASCFPEIAGDAGAYFDGNSESDIGNVIEKVIYDGKLKKELVDKGSERLKIYGWDKTVENTYNLYKSLL